jgi:capsular polysaccharide biosynthesis protein
MVQQNHIARKILILVNFDDIPNPQIFPFPGDKSNPAQKLDFTLILLLITIMSFEVLYEIYNHRNEDNDKERQKNCGFAFRERNYRDRLEYSNE